MNCNCGKPADAPVCDECYISSDKITAEHIANLENRIEAYIEEVGDLALYQQAARPVVEAARRWRYNAITTGELMDAIDAAFPEEA